MAWISPDNKIKKYIINEGDWGFKPTENCKCSIQISDSSSNSILKYHGVNEITIGDCGNTFERLLHICLLTMNNGEKSKCVFKLKEEEEVSFTLTLMKFDTEELIYTWDARKKCDVALKQKVKGNDLFNQFQYIDASHCFGKALKLLCSIPIPVDEPCFTVDDVDVKEIYQLRAILYNNLASCYLKHHNYDSVITLCQKVLALNSVNVKALYKQGVAKCETGDFEGACESLSKVVNLEPNNKAALQKLKFVNIEIAKSNAELNTIIKRMFGK